MREPGSVGRVNGTTYSGTPVHAGQKPGTVYRTLLLAVSPDTANSSVRYTVPGFWPA
ncbi:hypothetical protein MAHJHV55_51770 [Mycobacterium avium subsp. hominissuis]